MNSITGKKTRVLIVLSAIIGFFAFVALPSQDRADAAKLATPTFRYVPNEAFGYGERLDYKVKYGLVTAGEGYFQVMPKPVTYNGRESYDIRFQVNSLKSLEWLYKVKDSYRTVLDVAGIFPWHFEQHVREGNYRRDFNSDFDQIGNYAIVDDKKTKIPPYAHDIVSAFFFVRTRDLGSMNKGDVFYLKNYFGDTTYNLGVKVRGRQTITVEAGTFNCIIIEPLVQEGGLFKSDGQILIWVTDDDRKMPVKVATKIPIGYVTAELTSYQGLRGPVQAKVN